MARLEPEICRLDGPTLQSLITYMNIVVFQNSSVDPEKGGINRMSKAYFDLLAAQGHSVYFLSMRDRGTGLLPRQLLVEEGTREEQCRSFKGIVDQYQLALMIYQDGITPSNNHILRWAKSKNLILVDILHNSLRGMYGIEGHERLSKVQPMFLRATVNWLVNNYFKLKYGKRYREQFSLSDRVVLLSDKYRDEIRYFTGWRDFSKFTAITNPLTMDRPASINRNKKNTVLHVALLSKPKRQDLLLAIWSRVERKRPDWTLKIVGDGPLRASLIEKANTLQLKHVEFLGFQSPQPFYDEASVFCLTSGHEGFGLVLVEAMAYGCVPMAFNSWEMASDIIDNEVNGILVKPFNVETYAEKLMALMDDEPLRDKMARSALEKSHAFDMDKVSCLWQNLLDELKREKS